MKLTPSCSTLVQNNRKIPVLWEKSHLLDAFLLTIPPETSKMTWFSENSPKTIIAKECLGEKGKKKKKNFPSDKYECKAHAQESRAVAQGAAHGGASLCTGNAQISLISVFWDTGQCVLDLWKCVSFPSVFWLIPFWGSLQWRHPWPGGDPPSIQSRPSKA